MSSDPCVEDPPPGLAQGIEEFNRGEFFECHETLELLWRAETRPVRQVYQGILQIGVAFHHIRRGHYRAAAMLFGRGARYLEPFAPRCLGVDLASLIAAAARCRAELERLGPDRLAEFDWSLVPRIQPAAPDRRASIVNRQS